METVTEIFSLAHQYRARSVVVTDSLALLEQDPNCECGPGPGAGKWTKIRRYETA
jgi:hypothetical protein